MFRFLNIVAVAVLVGSAVYAYEIKYSTLYQAEQLAKAKRDLARETDRVAMLKAEWAHIVAPDRIQTLADKYLGGQTLQLTQIVAAGAVPEKAARGDEIASKLSDLGLDAPTKTPSASGAPPTPSKPAAAPKPSAPASAIKPPAKPAAPRQVKAER
ncbi:hypothetical protein SAMN06265338_108138 [Rhodoblastus acidophilus]|uniref:Cell division protein FtsL n=1 Tax=Rhodoblastus acidophilus TaxID=1074 RepID=A0A212RXN7_RHOAC|nr:hypothetical protein [Rhodoblastus acidophilus]SNB77468.1 hypothetical protein SAMN06265338_108138 [Rhodoblastus acidophilus]